MLSGQVWTKLLYVIAIEFDLIGSSIMNLIKNSIPGLSDDLLTDWETELGLPDECSPIAGSISERQQIVHAKYITKYDGLSTTFFVSYAANMGSTITIIENYGGGEPFRVNTARVDRVMGDIDGSRLWSLRIQHVWEVQISSSDPNKNTLHCIFLKIKPAHTQLVWTEV
jgi:uncharacterized protein YmfQ (DUF2313 family)